jgi:hypothetical protein
VTLGALTRPSNDLSVSHVTCPSCGQVLQFARIVRGTDGLVDLQTFACRECSLWLRKLRRNTNPHNQAPRGQSLDDERVKHSHAACGRAVVGAWCNAASSQELSRRGILTPGRIRWHYRVEFAETIANSTTVEK